MSSFLPVHWRPSIVLRWYYAIARCGHVFTFCGLCRERGWVTLKFSLYISGPFNLPDVTINRISNLREVPVPTLDVKVRISLLRSVNLKDFPAIFLSACIRSARFFIFPVAYEKFWSPRPWMSLIIERKSRLCDVLLFQPIYVVCFSSKCAQIVAGSPWNVFKIVKELTGQAPVVELVTFQAYHRHPECFNFYAETQHMWFVSRECVGTYVSLNWIIQRRLPYHEKFGMTQVIRVTFSP